jgi:hypothetical protein
MKPDLLTNATVFYDAIRFVSDKRKDKEKSLANSNEDDKEKSNEPDYDEGKVLSSVTTNQVF